MATTVDSSVDAIKRLFAKSGSQKSTSSSAASAISNSISSPTTTNNRKVDTDKLFPAVIDMFNDVVTEINKDPVDDKIDDGTYTGDPEDYVGEKDERGEDDPLGEIINEETEKDKREQEEALRLQKVARRDVLLGQRLGYEESAVGYINNLIRGEKSNADLFGIEYDMSDDIKQSRINNYFSTLWTEDQETELANLFDAIGRPEGFTDFVTRRGSGTFSNRQSYGRQTLSRSRGMKTPEDFDNILTGYMPLGGVNSILGA